VDTLIRDLRFALRMLARKPLIAVIAVASLALGIGANTTIFSIVNALFLESLPVPEQERLVSLHTSDRRNPGLNPLSHLNWKDLREQNDVFEELAGYDWTGVSVSFDGGEPAVVFGQLAAGNYFDALGLRAELGRTFRPEEDGAPGAHPVAVLSHRFWKEKLGGSDDVLGRKILVNGIPFDVIGVTPASFTGLDVGVEPDLYLPMAMNAQVKPNAEVNWYDTRRGLFLFGFGRLAPGVSLSQARAAVDTIAQRLATAYPDDNEGRGFAVRPLTRFTTAPGLRDAAMGATGFLMVIVGLVLLIACANVANLLLARATGRRKEIAVRLSLGAGRRRILRQLLTESSLLALLGAAAGLLVASWARSALMSYLPSLPFPITVALDLRLDPRVLAFTLVLAVLTGVLAGLAPAIRASRPDLVDALKERGSAEVRGNRLVSARNLLVGAQVALSLVALLGAGLFIRSLGAARQMDPGHPVDHLVQMGFDVGLAGHGPERGEQFFREVLERTRALPGVERATLAQAGPLQAGFLRSVFPEGREGDTTGTFVGVNVVVPGYFETLGIPVLRGRALDERDVAGAPKAVVINEVMAERFWPGEDALGKLFRFHGDDEPVAQVVGIARTVSYNAIGEDPAPFAYEALAQRYVTNMTLIARSAGDPEAAVLPIQRVLQEMDPELAIVGAATVSSNIEASLWASQLGATLLAVFGFLALVLAGIGMYGVMAYAVGQRAQEIGIRMALGADRRAVMGMVLGQGMLVVGLGLALGLVLAWALSGMIQSMLFIGARDLLVWGVTTGLLALVGLFANWWPALRATHVDPVIALRSE
jgi:predicted permease